ncbi:MAG: ROK family protein [Gemmataceae bacterium]
MNILVIDVGGTNVKIALSGVRESRKIPSGPTLSAAEMVRAVLNQATDWSFDAVSLGYPGPVIAGQILKEPVNLGPGWVGYDFAAGFGKPVRIINDAAMQALGSYEGGRMLFLGLGTGLGSCAIYDNVICPMELGHLPYRRGRTFEMYVGQAGLKKMGRRRWQAAVYDVVARLQAALLPEYVVLGGGNVKRLEELPPGCRLGDNDNAFTGGFRLWQRDA